jgi:hypothetical protein
VKKWFELHYEGYTPADIVRELELSEVDALEVASNVNRWLAEIQREACYQDSYKRFCYKS